MIMEVIRIQSWNSTKAVIIPMPDIALRPRRENSGNSREVWHVQLITLPETDVTVLDEPDVTFDFTAVLAGAERIE